MNDADVDKTAGWIIFLVVLACLLLLVFIVWLVVYCVKSNRKKRLTLAYRSVGTVKGGVDSPSSTRSGGSDITKEKERRESFTQSGSYKNHWGSLNK